MAAVDDRNLSSTSSNKYPRRTRWSYETFVTVEENPSDIIGTEEDLRNMYTPPSSEEDETSSDDESLREKKKIVDDQISSGSRKYSKRTGRSLEDIPPEKRPTVGFMEAFQQMRKMSEELKKNPQKMFKSREEEVMYERIKKIKEKRKEIITTIANSEKNNPEMSMEMLDWLECYNEWQYGGNPTAISPGPPPFPETWDPVARARIKAPEHLKEIVRTAEMAIQFYNENHQDSDFEVVEILSARSTFTIGFWDHFNFTAKSKSASPDDKQSLQTFFAEHFNDDVDVGMSRKKVTEGQITACCLLEKGSTSTTNCIFCSKKKKVLHPLKGFVYLNEDCW